MEQSVNKPRDLVVRNSVVVLTITAIVFLAMLACVFEYNSDLGTWGYVIVAALIPVIAYFIKKKIQTAVITINRNGIYSYGKLVTDWKHFKTAKIDQLPLGLGDPRDKVVLIIFFYNAGADKLFEQQLRLYNTLNKSEEQIMAAIELFFKLSR
jgi:hypothetical protein